MYNLTYIQLLTTSTIYSSFIISYIVMRKIMRLLNVLFSFFIMVLKSFKVYIEVLYI